MYAIELKEYQKKVLGRDKSYAPEVEQSLHSEGCDAGGDDGEGEVGAVGNKNVVRPVIERMGHMRRTMITACRAVVITAGLLLPEEPRRHENKNAG